LLKTLDLAQVLSLKVWYIRSWAHTLTGEKHRPAVVKRFDIDPPLCTQPTSPDLFPFRDETLGDSIFGSSIYTALEKYVRTSCFFSSGERPEAADCAVASVESASDHPKQKSPPW